MEDYNRPQLRKDAHKILALLEKKGEDSELAGIIGDGFMPYTPLKEALETEVAKEDGEMDYAFFSDAVGFFRDENISIDAPIPQVSITDEFSMDKNVGRMSKAYARGIQIELQLPEEMYDKIAECTSDYSMHLHERTVLFNPSRHKLSLHKQGASTDSSKDVFKGEEANFIAEAYSCITSTLVETAKRAKELGDDFIFTSCGVLYKYFTSLSSENCNQQNAMDFANLLKRVNHKDDDMEFKEVSAKIEYDFHDESVNNHNKEDQSLLGKNDLDSKTHHTNPHLRGSNHHNAECSFIEESGIDLSGENAVEAPVELIA